jgi:hypothetical protein
MREVEWFVSVRHCLIAVVFTAWLLLLSGCASRPVAGARPFRFPADGLSLTNETEWVYSRDLVTGEQRHTDRVPAPTYTQRCFPLTRTVKQFHAHADFQPTAARADEAEYRRLIRAVLARSPRTQSSREDRIVIPGYDGLHDFSAAWPGLFREECGAPWRSYLQRGNWRMVLPFTGNGQAAEAERLAKVVEANGAPVVHVTNFPRLRINHALLLYGVTRSATGLQFAVYDPNNPLVPLELTFDARQRRFLLAPTAYFLGGPVKVYEVYSSPWR